MMTMMMHFSSRATLSCHVQNITNHASQVVLNKDCLEEAYAYVSRGNCTLIYEVASH